MLSFFLFYSIGTLEEIARSTRYLSSFSQVQVPNMTLELLILLPFSLFLVFSALCLLLCRSHPWHTSFICWTYNMLPVSNNYRLPGNRSEIISIVPGYRVLQVHTSLSTDLLWLLHFVLLMYYHYSSLSKVLFCGRAFSIAGTNFPLQDTLTTRYPKKKKTKYMWMAAKHSARRQKLKDVKAV